MKRFLAWLSFLYSFIVIAVVLILSRCNQWAVFVCMLLMDGCLAIKTTWFRASVGERPLLYESVVVQFFLTICSFLSTILTILLLFINWRLVVAGLVIQIFLGKPVLYKISEFLFVDPIYYTMSMY